MSCAFLPRPTARNQCPTSRPPLLPASFALIVPHSELQWLLLQNRWRGGLWGSIGLFYVLDPQEDRVHLRVSCVTYSGPCFVTLCHCVLCSLPLRGLLPSCPSDELLFNLQSLALSDVTSLRTPFLTLQVEPSTAQPPLCCRVPAPGSSLVPAPLLPSPTVSVALV